MDWPEFVRATARLGVPLSSHQEARLREYTQRLLAANRRVNLTALRDESALLQRYLLDSLALLPVMAQTLGCSVEALRARSLRGIDVGSGGGAPGIPLAIAWPALRMTLVEATAKKARFLQEVTQSLELPVPVLSQRAEEVAHQPAHRERYDLVTARAVAALPALVELTLPFLRVGGWAFFPKGERAGEETQAALAAIQILGGEEVQKVPYPGSDAGAIVVIRKVATTPERYPRRPGVPTRRPLLRGTRKGEPEG